MASPQEGEEPQLQVELDAFQNSPVAYFLDVGELLVLSTTCRLIRNRVHGGDSSETWTRLAEEKKIWCPEEFEKKQFVIHDSLLAPLRTRAEGWLSECIAERNAVSCVFLPSPKKVFDWADPLRPVTLQRNTLVTVSPSPSNVLKVFHVSGDATAERQGQGSHLQAVATHTLSSPGKAKVAAVDISDSFLVFSTSLNCPLPCTGAQGEPSRMRQTPAVVAFHLRGEHRRRLNLRGHDSTVTALKLSKGRRSVSSSSLVSSRRRGRGATEDLCLSVSYDGTGRLWNLRSGQLNAVLRPFRNDSLPAEVLESSTRPAERRLALWDCDFALCDVPAVLPSEAAGAPSSSAKTEQREAERDAALLLFVADDFGRVHFFLSTVPDAEDDVSILRGQRGLGFLAETVAGRGAAEVEPFHREGGDLPNSGGDRERTGACICMAALPKGGVCSRRRDGGMEEVRLACGYARGVLRVYGIRFPEIVSAQGGVGVGQGEGNVCDHPRGFSDAKEERLKIRYEVRTLFSVPAHGGLLVVSVATDPGGHVIATGGRDGMVRLWDGWFSQGGGLGEGGGDAMEEQGGTGEGRRGPLLTELKAASMDVKALAIGDGLRCIVAGAFDGTVRIWRTPAGALEGGVSGSGRSDRATGGLLNTVAGGLSRLLGAREGAAGGGQGDGDRKGSEECVVM
uniref:Uncharacterized protein n=1 Tax=Chromera velia CCMP2878 TaxID=1169474 RepID=A0A0G4FPZ9_9ALVE|eukprot:Cvel_3594.t1-p1 / transcript=Cvel_3594.t1 / gene=Cvel_3594 / organism=Chromera_velia_CCMP2878 / gene_product=hypothetical protein / transcript_product=hypothetical protein / location=Cvel_scaffold147:53728-58161(+) / protein_length=678 / sequence_SO=supercontig / SO=protein_coding / is_pseudo=false